jgi:quercetin dioxygenase-like cupin family protein
VQSPEPDQPAREQECEHMTQEPDRASGAAPGSANRVFGRDPMLVRKWEATRFLWGDEESGQVSDLIYGRGERISAVSYSLGPGHWFGASKVWKPLYDQHRFYYVVQGSLAIHDPQSGQVEVATRGNAITWRGARYHFGYNTGTDEVVVLDWFAPPDRGLDTPEIATMPDKPEVGEIAGGRYELLGAWPDRRPEVLTRTLSEGGLATVGPATALHFAQGSRRPLLVSILSSSSHLTAGTFSLAAGGKSEPEQHPGDEVVYAVSGQLHVHLTERGDWFELNPLDCLYIPEGILHEYWSYGAGPVTAAFCVAPKYH